MQLEWGAAIRRHLPPVRSEMIRTASLRLCAFLVRLEWGKLTEDDPDAIALIRYLGLIRPPHDPERDPSAGWEPNGRIRRIPISPSVWASLDSILPHHLPLRS